MDVTKESDDNNNKDVQIFIISNKLDTIVEVGNFDPYQKLRDKINRDYYIEVFALLTLLFICVVLFCFCVKAGFNL